MRDGCHYNMKRGYTITILMCSDNVKTQLLKIETVIECTIREHMCHCYQKNKVTAKSSKVLC